MSVYVYASGQYHPLEGNQIVSGGQMVTMKAEDELAVNGSRFTVGDPVASASIISGAFITTTENYANKMLDDVTVANGGVLTVSGGIVKNLNVNSGGTAVLQDVDTTSDSLIKVNSVGSAVISNSLLNSVYVSGYISSSITKLAYCSIDGGAVQTLICDRGNVTITDISISGATVNYEGRMYVSSGGTANSTTVSAGGRMYVSSGGTANSITVNSGGTLTVNSGGVALNVSRSVGGIVSSYEGSIVTYANN